MKKFTVKKGQHKANPLKFKVRWKPLVVPFHIHFPSNAIYELDKNKDQWNKALGITYSLVPNRYAALIGWRYNSKSGDFDITPYVNDDYTQFYRGNPIITCPVGGHVTGMIKIDYNLKVYSFVINCGYRTITHKIPFTHSRVLARFIYHWFGGSEAASDFIDLYIDA